MSALELRQYTMVPGRRDEFAAIFDREFVETQEALGIEVVGQFRDLDRPDRYVWMRRFPDMDSRRRSLDAFYSGPVWAEHADAANATMTEWHDVLLLTPAWEGAQLVPGPRPAVGQPLHAAVPPLVVTVLAVPPDGRAAVAARAHTLLAGNPSLLGAYVTLPEPNTYPRLPIRDDASVLVLIGRGESALAPSLPGVAQVLRLQPTSRSRLA